MTLRLIDLFSGAGGLTEGFHRLGFEIVCHVEMDKAACETLKLRDYYYFLKENNRLNDYKRILEKDSKKEVISNIPIEISKRTIHQEINDNTINCIFDQINNILGKNKEVSGVIGGPPCQAYSTIGRARNQHKKSTDTRIYLYKYYIEFLKKYNPHFFVFENVKGLLSFKDINGEYLFTRKNGLLKGKMYDEFIKAGYNIDFNILNTKNYEVPQSRERIIIFGVKKEEKNLTKEFFVKLNKLSSEETIPVKKVFEDLPVLKAGDVVNKYKKENPNEYIKKYYRQEKVPLTQNEARAHNKRDLKIYKLVVEAKRRNHNLKYNELPVELKTHRRENDFLDRFKALSWEEPSHTIVAHIAKDGNHYIHPDICQNRSITIREAARLQGFPDDFYFLSSRTQAFKQIGNAVPPIFSEKIAKIIKSIFNSLE